VRGISPEVSIVLAAAVNSVMLVIDLQPHTFFKHQLYETPGKSSEASPHPLFD